jgi:ubiquinone/menaquinone biosynthesis C-methylase UbiE/uncharacterized protein YbaR (Trm112 family)
MNTTALLACPTCKGFPLSESKTGYICTSCNSNFSSFEGIPVFLRKNSAIIAEESFRAEFWDAGWDKRNKTLLSLSREEILKERNNYLSYLTVEGYPSAIDLSETNVGGKSFLNIGCGGGYEGLLFAGYGTHYIGVDFSYNAVQFTKKLIENAGFHAETYQCEAEALPFQNASIDVVYSSGVLHHTPNTEDALKEIFRVLKPGGMAMIGLYATYSPMFIWYRLHALIRGNWTKKSINEWMNTNTEGEWQTENRKNLWTKTYNKLEFINLMSRAGFSGIQIQQQPQMLKDFPILGKLSKVISPKYLEKIKLGRFGPMLIVTCTRQK